MLAPDERHRLLVAWNDTATDYPNDRCVHELFEAQAARHPDAIAVVFGEEQLTYGELDARANRLAHHLRTLGVGPDVLVGLCAERSTEMVVGLVGILKAGGAYVPLDPRYPRERLHFIIEDTGLDVLVTHGSSAPALPTRCRVVPVDSTSPGTDSNGPAHGKSPNHLAYVIYTSGSTGVPKGVAIEHHSTVSFLRWVRTAFADDELAGMLGSTSICFSNCIVKCFCNSICI